MEVTLKSSDSLPLTVSPSSPLAFLLPSLAASALLLLVTLGIELLAVVFSELKQETFGFKLFALQVSKIAASAQWMIKSMTET